MNGALSIFLASFGLVAVKAFQQLNVTKGRYAWAIPTSFVFAVVEVLLVTRYVSEGFGWVVLPMGAGGALGCIVAMRLHDRACTPVSGPRWLSLWDDAPYAWRELRFRWRSWLLRTLGAVEKRHYDTLLDAIDYHAREHIAELEALQVAAFDLASRSLPIVKEYVDALPISETRRIAGYDGRGLPVYEVTRTKRRDCDTHGGIELLKELEAAKPEDGKR